MTFLSRLLAGLGLRAMEGAKGGYVRPMTPPEDHLRLEEAFRECPGQWVAIHRPTGAIKAAAATPYELAARLKSEQITDVDVIRAPAVGEPEVVGFG